MSLSILYSRAQIGVDAPLVTVETHIANGLPRFHLVGLPETAMKESKDRVRSAILSSRFKFPSKCITVNLGPADLPKHGGGRFDLAIALGILFASYQLPHQILEDYEIAGELALSGEVRPIQATLPLALATRKAKRTLIIPTDNADEASLSGDLNILPVKHLLDLHSHFSGNETIALHKADIIETLPEQLDIADVRGQTKAKRALKIAAAGNHNMLMMGPPGTGKTMLASRLPGILPNLPIDDALEVAAIYSISGQKLDTARWRQRPFRSPHHTASSVALVGGGSIPRPGEISLAHHGVLFLDELPEFDRRVLETLREPLESGRVTISRAARQAEFPARFQLIAAMNPCPCGQLGNPKSHCECTPDQIKRYRSKISGPLLDRIDLHVDVPCLARGALSSKPSTPIESSDIIRERVEKARDVQLTRQDQLNALLHGKALEMHCCLKEDDRNFLEEAVQTLGLSARAYHRVLKVARTVADLNGAADIDNEHLCEALGFRFSAKTL